MATLALRQWCQDSRLLRQEFLDAQSAAQELCSAVPDELSDQLLIKLNDIQEELEAVDDQRLVGPLIRELRYLIGELDKITEHVMFENEDWRTFLDQNGFSEMSNAQIAAYNQSFPRAVLPAKIADRWLYWQKGNQVFAKTDDRIVIAETNPVDANHSGYNMVIFDLEPVISRNLFQDVYELGEDPVGNTFNRSVPTDQAFFRDPVPYSSMITEVTRFVTDGGIARRRRYVEEPYRQKYWLKGRKDLVSAPRLPDTGGSGSLPGSLTLPYEDAQTEASEFSQD